MPQAETLPDVATLEKLAAQLRRVSLSSTAEAGSGHPTTCMSCADIVSALFFHEMRFDPGSPGALNTDAFVLSKGHAAPILWAALKEAGAISEDPMTLRKYDSPLEGHPTPTSPWVRVATGSLGQGLSAAVGMALGKRMNQIPARVYCLLGDGETAEGSVWEAALIAAHHRLDNLVAIIDVNGLGQSGPTLARHDLYDYVAKFKAFGWNAMGINGHDMKEILRALAVARGNQERPTAIIAGTEKGKGVSFLEGKEGWHGKPVKKGDELQRALAKKPDPGVRIRVPARRVGSEAPRNGSFNAGDPSLTPPYSPGQEVATREAYGAALVRLGAVSPDVVVLDAEVKNSTFAEKFKTAFPDRFVECFIAEQNMAGMALGLAAEGKIPFASTFACFLTRAYDQIRMAAYSRPSHLIFCGSHVGVSIGEDGPSQMGLEDLSMFRAVFGSTIFYPCDGVSAERLTALAARTPGVVYLRTSRPKTKVIYSATEKFVAGGSKTLKSSPKDAATVVAAGITVFEALKAHEILAKEGVAIRVIDAYSIKPLDEATLRKSAAETKRLITVEDHGVSGGLGEAVAALGLAPRILAVREISRSGPPEKLIEAAGISADAIVKAVKA